MSCNRDACLCVGAEDALTEEIGRLRAQLATADRRVADMREAAAKVAESLEPDSDDTGWSHGDNIAKAIRALPGPDREPNLVSVSKWYADQVEPRS